MNLTVNKIKNRIEIVFTRISSIMIPIFQFVPATAIWRGIMSIPFITYLAFFFQNPGILKYDIQFLFKTHGIYITFFGFIFFIFALVYQLTHRNQLIRQGPYNYVRHPQYLGFIIMTFGMTSVAFQTYPIFNFDPYYISGYTIIFYIWITEILAYVFLGKIEDIALKAKYGDEFLEYVNNVPFMFPTIKLKKNNFDHEIEKK